MKAISKPLRLPAYRRLVAAYGVDALGTWLGEIALAVLVLRETGSAVAVAAVWVVGQFVPSLVVPLLVARVDRLAPRRILPLLFAGQFAAFAVLAVTARTFSLVLVLALAATSSALGQTARALIKASIVAVTRPNGLLREGNAILIGIFSTCAAAGPVIGGVVLAIFSVQAALVVDAASFALAAVLLGVRVDIPHAAQEGAQPKGRLRSALEHVRAQPLLSRLLVAFAAVSLFGAAIIPVELLLVTGTLGGSTSAYGLVLGAWGIGAVAGSALLALLRRASVGRLVTGSFLLLALSYVGMGTAATVETVVIFSAIGGVANGIEGFAVMTAIQEQTSDAFQARVGGLVEALASATTGLGFFLGGAIASAGSTRAVYIVAGFGLLAAAAIVPRRRLARRPTPEASPAVA
jgi:predicted MFS family arabinose efflux permease